MTTALTTVTEGAVIHWTEETKQLVREQYRADNLTDAEFSLFLGVAGRLGLDPLKREIYAIKREQYNSETRRKEAKMVLQTGIDGYRVIAERTGQYAGVSSEESGPPCVCDIAKAVKHPEWVQVGVRKIVGGSVFETVARAHFDEYVATKGVYKDGKPTGQHVPNAMWTKMPWLMTAKVAEALALRRAFPGRFEGVYTAEEMQQADNTVQSAVVSGSTASGVSTAPLPKEIGPCFLCEEEGLTAKSGKPSSVWRFADGREVCGGCKDGEAVRHTPGDTADWSAGQEPPETEAQPVGLPVAAPFMDARFDDEEIPSE